MIKAALLELLRCPNCRGTLGPQSVEDGEDARIDGFLVCNSCARPYPVIDGVPNFLPDAFREHPDAARLYRREVDAAFRSELPEEARFRRLHGRTARAFGYEWQRYEVTTKAEDKLTFAALVGIDPGLYRAMPFADVFTHFPTEAELAAIDFSLLEGKRVLELGCGMGKYLRVVSEVANHVVGLDVSASLERARGELRDVSNIDLVRGNIFEAPFLHESFDFVYSVGVLHHTPDCSRAFTAGSKLVREGGHFAVWLYPTERHQTRYARMVHFIQDRLLRPVTCRLPHGLLFRLCDGLGYLSQLRDRAVAAGRYRWAGLLSLVAVGSHPKREIAAFLNFDWYSPQYRSYHSEDELLGWFQREGFDAIRILPQRTSGIARKASGVAPGDLTPVIRANLEQPVEATLRPGDLVEVAGWAFEEHGRSVQIEARLGRRRSTALCTDARLDVKHAYPDIQHALYVGFATVLRVPWNARGTLRLEVELSCPGTDGGVQTLVREVAVEPQSAPRRLARVAARSLLPAPLRRAIRRRLPLRSEGAAEGITDTAYREWLGRQDPPGDPVDVGGFEFAQVGGSAEALALSARRAGVESMRWWIHDAAEGIDAAPLPQVEPVAAGDANPLILASDSEYLGFLEHGVLAEGARAAITRYLRNHPECDWLYGDYDVEDDRGRRSRPVFGPGPSPELLLLRSYCGPLLVLRRSLFEKIGGIDARASAAYLYDLALRATEVGGAGARVPRVLSHLPREVPDRRARREYAAGEARAAARAIARRGLAAERIEDRRREPRLRFDRPEDASIAILIPSRNNASMLDRCIRSVEANTRYSDYEICIVDDASDDPETREYLEATPHRVVSAPDRCGFNFARLINYGAAACRSRFLLFLNDDTEAVTPDWLGELVGYGTIPEVGAVGAKLLYPNGRLQHLGVVLGHEGLAGHYFQGEADDRGYLGLKLVARNVAAVTAACLLTPRKVFLEAGGMDEKHLAVGWNDVDYCLRLAKRGLRTVVNPLAVLLHHEGASRGDGKNPEEVRFFRSRWEPWIEDDPFYHPAFSRTGQSYCLRTAHQLRLFYDKFASPPG